MTHKEKGIELVDRFRIFVGSTEGDEGETIKNYLVSKHVAKRAALICCDEILAYLDETISLTLADGGEKPEPEKYWQQVKSAIQQL